MRRRMSCAGYRNAINLLIGSVAMLAAGEAGTCLDSSAPVTKACVNLAETAAVTLRADGRQKITIRSNGELAP